MPYVKTDRLTLVTFTIEMMRAALLSNKELEKITTFNVPPEYPMEVYKELLPYKIERFSQYPEENEWEGIIVHTGDNVIIGDLGFKGGPDENGEMDLGYSILPKYQGNRFATEMAVAMVRWGLKHPKVKKITASCSNENQASIRVLEKAGLKQTDIKDNEIYWAIENK
ncbi:GNAT family N-acetyltransferase [Paraliobacillus salinarum]|uniref:GNAT family N-acetyltransferase n=1 Tax=Paraliobacillus salinarum TaxID=1158996 RepID=UPI0015F3AC9A|nr:GNAT family N-acetyltransferase [Paraliobacillus salinarum]